MSIEELMGLLEDRTTTLTPEEFRLVKDHCERYTLLASLQGAKRKMDAPEDGAPAPKRREFKYTNIEKLTIGASLRKFTDWKADMERLFQGNTEKFGTDSMKLIAAHQYMDTKAKTLWQTHIHTNPGDDRWGPFLQWAQQMVTQGANFEITTYQEHHNAKQRPSQSPVRFDAYLSALESVMGERGNTVNTMDFFTRSQVGCKPEWNSQDESNSRSPDKRWWPSLSESGTGWNGREKSERTKEELATAKKPRQQPSSRPSVHYRTDRAAEAEAGDKASEAAVEAAGINSLQDRAGPIAGLDLHRKKNPFPTGRNAKGEACCFKCGSTAHFAAKCDGSGPSKETESITSKTLAARTSRVTSTRAPQSYEALTSESDSSEN